MSTMDNVTWATTRPLDRPVRGSPKALQLSSREVFAAGERPVTVSGPLLEDEAAEVVAEWAVGRAGE